MSVKIYCDDPIKTPRAVIFDTDNTLYPYEPAHRVASRAVVDKANSLLGVDEETFNAAFAEARKDIKQRLGETASSHSRLLYLQKTVELLGVGTRILLTLDLEQTYWRNFLQNCSLFVGVMQFIQALKSRGVVVANITDLTVQIQFRKLVYFGLDEYFDLVVTSEEAGRDKPDLLPFQLAIEKLGDIDLDRVWMIGDNAVNDIQGANRAGLISVQKVHQGVEFVDTVDGRPYFSFERYADLSRYLEGLK